MIQEFSIENTFSIKTRQTISFEAVQDSNEDAIHYIQIGNTRLLKFAAIFGSNASGKSNMLKAVDFYINFTLNAFSDLKPKENTGFTAFAFDPDTVNSPGSFELTFFFDEIKYDYQLQMDTKCVHTEKLTYSPKGQKKLIYQRNCVDCTGDCDNLVYEWKWGDTLVGSKKKISEMTRPNTTFLNTAAQLEHPDLGKIYNHLRMVFMPTITPGTRGLMNFTMRRIEKNDTLKKDILNLLEKSDFSQINDIVLKTREVPSSFLDTLPDEAKEGLKNTEGKYVMKELLLSHKYGANYLLPITKESAGTQRLLELAGPLFEIIRKKHFICIDEIESSLHQELLEFILKTFLENSKESQILFTTHNLDLLDTEFLLDDEIWFSEKDENGGSNYKGFVEYTGVRKGSPRKKLYNAGKFGAKPIISTLITD
jgi:AAA15 family ATPase/GTPase